MADGHENQATPTGVVITATAPDGTTTNVTEGVQALYDNVISSMDWGSGFLTIEDVEPIYDLAKACGFKDAEAAVGYMEEARKRYADWQARANPIARPSEEGEEREP